jgi:hypothetical protein
LYSNAELSPGTNVSFIAGVPRIEPSALTDPRLPARLF